jgi:hypothetical protein
MVAVEGKRASQLDAAPADCESGSVPFRTDSLIRVSLGFRLRDDAACRACAKSQMRWAAVRVRDNRRAARQSRSSAEGREGRRCPSGRSPLAIVGGQQTQQLNASLREPKSGWRPVDCPKTRCPKQAPTYSLKQAHYGALLLSVRQGAI